MKTIYYFISILVYSNLVAQSERILSFESILTVHKDSSLEVQEKIIVESTGTSIKHGIVREFPTWYADRWGNNYHVGYKVKKILKEDVAVPFQIKKEANGEKIYIGDKHTQVPPGIHTYSITYITTRQLGFFKNFDELYWNVTGNGWRLPIDQATAFVHLPDIPLNDLKVTAYTGPQGSKGQAYKTKIESHGVITIKTTEKLPPFQGLTIAIAWPKGYIQPPSQLTNSYYLLKDNISILVLIIGFLITSIFYIVSYRRARRTKTGGTSIPLFTPPHGLSPSKVRYLYYGKYDGKAFATEILSMAIHRLLDIKFDKGFLFGGTYTLIAKDVQEKITDPDEQKLYTTFFHKHRSFELSKKNQSTLAKAVSLNKKNVEKFATKYIDFNTDSFLAGLLLSGATLFSSFFLQPVSLWFFIGVLAFTILNVLFYSLLQTYTTAGYKLYIAIEGFRLFLKTTEEERLKIIGTPPTKTPELFEKYLPYAVALNVEQAWSEKFAPIFAVQKEYKPVWYAGPYTSFNPSVFSSNFTNSVASVASRSISIASSSLPPGSSSGSDGGGSSGGGGGGGGGGGW